MNASPEKLIPLAQIIPTVTRDLENENCLSQRRKLEVGSKMLCGKSRDEN